MKFTDADKIKLTDQEKCVHILYVKGMDPKETPCTKWKCSDCPIVQGGECDSVSILERAERWLWDNGKFPVNK